MARIILISCSKTQKQGLFMARDLYQGKPFKQSLANAEAMVDAGRADHIYILSTWYGLLDPRRVVANYNYMPANAKQWNAWAQMVMAQLVAKGHNLSKDKFVFLTTQKFYNRLVNPPRSFPQSIKKAIYYADHQNEQQQRVWLLNQLP